MARAPTVESTQRARAIEAVLRPLLDLFEAATGQPVAFFADLHIDDARAGYAYSRDGGLSETRLVGASPLPAESGLRIAARLHDAQGAVHGHLEATSLGGRPFDARARAALDACARVLDAQLAARAARRASAMADADLALRDPLTGLPNRAALASEMERMLARAQRDDMTVFAVCVGLSGLDERASHEGFDRQLATLAKRLSDSVRGGDVVARTGRHEFAVVGSIPRATAEASAAVVLRRLHARCTAPAPARIDLGFAVARIGAFDAQALLADAEENLLA